MKHILCDYKHNFVCRKCKSNPNGNNNKFLYECKNFTTQPLCKKENILGILGHVLVTMPKIIEIVEF